MSSKTPSKSKNSMHALGGGKALGMLVLVCIPLIFWGKSAQKDNQANRAVQETHLQSLKVPAEQLRTTLLDAPAYKGEYVSGGRVSSTYRYWSFIETKDWVLVNGKRGSNVCPHVLTDFVEVNVPQEVMGPEQMDVLTAAYRGKELDLMAHVPRFKEVPNGLAKCWGIGFDSERGLLTLGGKPLAVMAFKQPGLQALALTTAAPI